MATWLIALALAAPGWQEAPPPPLELHDGDRVAILGDALAESMREDGDLELLLTARFPEANVRFRNLAFAGDTVWGDALAAFDTAEDGYKRRLELIRQVEPTVVLLAFGANESWEGEEGLDRFLKGYERLLDDVKALGPREVVLLTPMPQENLGPPFPDPAGHNVEVARYGQAIRALAARRGLRVVDAAPAPHGEAPNSIPAYPLTDDGLHPTRSGHKILAWHVLGQLGLPAPADEPVVLKPRQAVDITPSLELAADGPTDTRPGPLFVCPGLPPGRYTLRAESEPVAFAGAAGWAEGIRLADHDTLEQVEQLRRAINRKNRLYFDQIRPQNNVYLFGFRKHEQGNNAAEIERFGPLIAEREAEIARLRQPRTKTYVLLLDTDEPATQEVKP